MQSNAARTINEGEHPNIDPELKIYAIRYDLWDIGDDDKYYDYRNPPPDMPSSGYIVAKTEQEARERLTRECLDAGLVGGTKRLTIRAVHEFKIWGYRILLEEIVDEART